MLSTKSHPEVVSEYIATELALGRIAEVGLVETAKKSGIHTSPFGVIPKKHKSNKWRLILKCGACVEYRSSLRALHSRWVKRKN